MSAKNGPFKIASLMCGQRYSKHRKGANRQKPSAGYAPALAAIIGHAQRRLTGCTTRQLDVFHHFLTRAITPPAHQSFAQRVQLGISNRKILRLELKNVSVHKITKYGKYDTPVAKWRFLHDREVFGAVPCPPLVAR